MGAVTEGVGKSKREQGWWRVDGRMVGGGKEGMGGLGMMVVVMMKVVVVLLGLIVVVGNIIAQCCFEMFGCRMQLRISFGVCRNSVFNVFSEK